jgi:hypothetical protein
MIDIRLPAGPGAGRLLRKAGRGWGVACLVSLLGACTPASVVMGLAGVATDTSIPWAVTKHLYAKATEGDPVLCMNLNSVQRALSVRCGSFDEGSLKAADIANPELQECPLSIAAEDPQLWPVLPELIEKGARLALCHQPPLVSLAQAQSCPEFPAASPAQIAALTWLATNDPRSIHHDVVRMLSCPAARIAGIDSVLEGWRVAGKLAPQKLGFGMFAALHPDHLESPLAHALERDGHSARGALGIQSSHKLPPGFEEALRSSHWNAMAWWLARVPELANRVPATAGSQLPWVPLARVLVPTFLAQPDNQKATIDFLMARGADPWQRLPFNPGMSVVSYARSINSPYIGVLDPPVLKPVPGRRTAPQDNKASPS